MPLLNVDLVRTKASLPLVSPELAGAPAQIHTAIVIRVRDRCIHTRRCPHRWVDSHAQAQESFALKKAITHEHTRPPSFQSAGLSVVTGLQSAGNDGTPRGEEREGGGGVEERRRERRWRWRWRGGGV